jgi:cytidylate kinase
MAASVVTFTLQHGTAGRAIAQLVASKLGYRYWDEEIIPRAAQLAGVAPDVITNAEHWPGRKTRLLKGLALPRRDRARFVAVEGQTGETGPLVDLGYYRFFVDRVVLQLAHAGGCVITGHAAQVTLKGRGPGVCNVLIQSGVETRVRRLAEQEGIGQEEALAGVRRADREQADFLKHVYQADLLDPSLYQLTLDPADLTESAAADVVVRFATALNEQPRAGGSRRGSRETQSSSSAFVSLTQAGAGR